ncbi:MAG TPA: DUF2231 domain-containing protein [Verrucomicrobiae bacterium]|nr:DUF2231 domain-containing protein [Verrucomicrobiae bacterium]
MSIVPDPLHPAIVHFPVVLIVLGCAAAWVAVFLRRGNLPWFAAVLLTLGAAGAWTARETGQSDGGLLDNLSPKMEALLDAHEYWAGKTVLAATVTALLALTAAGLSRAPRLARSMAVVAEMTASIAAWTVYETGHRGGALVFEYGAGVQVGSSADETGSGDAGQTVSTKAKVESDAGEPD